MSKELQSAIKNNLFWFFASLVIALMVWFVAKIEANPVEQDSYTRPITILVDPGMIITHKSSDSARVFVSAQQTTLSILQLDDINVTVDLRGEAAGTYTVPLNVQIARPASSDTQPAQINVTIEERVLQQVRVDINVIAPPVNFQAADPQHDILQAVVSGASADVSRVSLITGDFDLSSQQSAELVERTVVLYAVDSEGNRVENLTIEPASIAVSVDVSRRDDIKTLTVRPDIDFDSLPENFEFSGFDYEPNSIIVTASPEFLATLNDTVDTLPISLEDRTGDFTIEVALDLPDDPELVIVDGSNIVEVDIFISEEDSTLPLENVPVRIIGLSEDSELTVTVNPLNVSVVLTGPTSVIDTITSEDVQAIVDVNGLGVGTHSVVPIIEVEQGQLNLNITRIPAEVTVTITAPQPEETESPATTPDAESTEATDG